MTQVSRLPEYYEALVQSKRVGITDTMSCKALGISISTYYHYLAIGKKDLENNVESLHAKFYKDIYQSRKDHVKKLVGYIQDAAAAEHKHWQAAAWLLERMYRRDFSAQGDLSERLAKLDKQINDLTNQIMGKTNLISNDIVDIQHD